MSKFNLKNYQKIPGDQHIDMRLKDVRGDIPEVINEKQLEDYRADESDVIVEKMLEKTRQGSEDEITEKRLDTHKAKFQNKYRNADAYEGDINKLEEKRLLNEPVENEKYSPASEIPAEFRWWDSVKSPDGLKVAQKNMKIAQNDDEEILESLMGDPMDEEERETITSLGDNEWRLPESGFEVTDLTQNKGDIGSMIILKKKDLPNENPELNAIYYVLAYDPDEFEGDEAGIKIAALSKVISERPELEGRISVDDFYDINEEGEQGTIKLRAFGKEFESIFKDTQPDLKSKLIIEDEIEGEIFEELSYGEQNLGGTPTVIGRVKINTTVNSNNREQIIKDVVDYIRGKHKELDIDEESLDLTNLDSKSEVGFMVGAPFEEDTEEDIEVTDLTAQNFNSKKN